MSTGGFWSRLAGLGRSERAERKPRRRAVLEGMEPRLLYSADLAPGLVETAEPAWEPEVADSQPVQTASAQTLGATLAFERNEGQAGANVDFLARGSGYAALLSDGNATLAFQRAGEWSTLRLLLDGSQSPAGVAGEDLLASRSNYLVGRQDQWHTDIVNFAAVRYDEVYEGIGLRYYGQGSQLEYDFIVAPGADAGQIALRFEGAASVSIADNGDLVIALGDTDDAVRFHAPVSYQNGANGRELVDSRYVIRDDGSVSFVLGAHDPGRAVVIDPTLDYGSYLGATGTDAVRDVALDGSGNMYATGSTSSLSAFATVGDVTFNGGTDAFVARYASNGALSWVTYYGGSGNDIGYGIDVDASGNVYIAGQTASTNLPTPNGANTTLGVGTAGFLARIDPSGNSVTYGTYGIEVSSADLYNDVAVADSGLVYITGGLGATGAHQLVVARYDMSLSGAASVLPARTDYLTSGDTWGSALAFDSAGRIHVVGTTSAAFTSTLPTNVGQSTFRGGASDGFLARLDVATLSWDYFSYIGGTGADEANAIAIDSADRSIVVGRTGSSGIASTGAYDTVLNSTTEAFVASFNTGVGGAASRVFTTYYGNGFFQDTRAYSVGVLTGGNIAFTGSTTSTALPVTADALDSTAGGGTDAFLAILNAQGTALVYGAYVGGAGTDVAYALAAQGNTVVLGGQTASDGLATAGGTDTTRSGTDGFLQRYTFGSAPTVVPEAVTTIAGETALYAFEPSSGSATSLVAGAPGMTVQSPVIYSATAGRVAGSTGLLFTADADTSTHPVSLPSIPNVASTQAFSFTGWVRFDTLDTAKGWERVFDFGAGPANNNLYLTRDSTNPSLSLALYSGGTFVDGLHAPGFLTGRVGEWIHVAVTLDASRQLTMYLNGTAVGTVTLALVPNFSTWTKNYIGSSNWTDDRQFRGAMDDIALFDRALTSTEVLALAQVPTPSASLNENPAAGATVFRALSNDPDPGDTQVFSLTDNAGGRFAINASTGVVTVANAALVDYEAGSNLSVVVRATDSSGAFDEQTFTIVLNDVDEFDAGAITDIDSTSNSVSENAANGTVVGITAFASDADGTTNGITYSLSNSAAGRFQIGGSSGVVTVANGSLLNSENATSHGITIVATSQDGSSSSQSFTVNVTGVNEFAPAITSNGGGATASVTLAENTAAVTTVTATDADVPAPTLIYTIVGGADATRFSIDAATGVLMFVAAPDYEAPADANADNVYDVTVQASDGSLTDTQAITVTVTALADEAPVISSDGGATTAAVGVAENATAVTTVAATDPDVPAQSVTYAIVGGADAARFTIDAVTGALAFMAAPDYQAPTDANADNVYDVTVQASDGSLTDTQVMAVTVIPVNNQSPVITSDGGGATASVTLVENATAVTTVAATDPDLPAPALMYTIVGGADAARFAIDAASGALNFITAPDYDAPADANADNVYDVTVQASDGSLSDTQAIAVTVMAVNDEAPVIASNGGGATASINAAENTTSVTTVIATDADVPAQTLTYAIVGGADAAQFSIDAATGVLAFIAAPDYEAPGDANADNVYDVSVQASDGSLMDTQVLAVTVTAVNEWAPVISSNGGGAAASVSVAENVATVTTVAATDADLPAPNLTYAMVGGADAAQFSIDAATGVLTFIAAPDFEAPVDANADNIYDITVQASDGSLIDTQAIAVTVTPANDQAPVITSDGGGGAASVTLAENTTAVTTVTATDADLPAQGLTFAIVGGADAARFSIDAATGVLAFTTAPDYEAPADANADNIYDVTVQASDGSLTDVQAIAVMVTPVNEMAPVIDSDGGGATAAVSMAENTTLVTTVSATDADLPAQTLTYAIVGGADAARFAIDSATGALTFIATPDYEAPADANIDNVYDVTVQASDGGLADTQAIAVTVTPVNDQAPAVTSNGGAATASVIVAENATAVTTVAAADGDLPAQTLTYAIVGGADAARFSIDAATGVLAFMTAPDYEAPADANADNVYDVIVQASDGGLTDTQAIAVTVTPVNELAPVITSNGGAATASVIVAENATAVTTVTAADGDLPAQTLTYAIVGGADAARFSIDAATGVLAFMTAPDYEAPADANADNVYDVTVQASDGGLTDTQAIAVTVTPVNELAPVITSNGGAATASVLVAENATAVTTVTAADGDLPAQTLTYAIVGGADAARFSIDATTGVLAFIAAPDYEAPADANADNVYDVIVQASDGGLTDTQAIAVTVAPVNELAPVITSNGGAATASVIVAENATAVTTVTAADGDLPAQTLTYAIVGGADAARFSIDATTGVLAFTTAPDYEAPADANADNVYDVIVQASDGGLTDTQVIAVTVTPVNELAPVITSNGGGASASVTAAENTMAVTTVAAADADVPAQTLTYAIVGGADAARFSIDAATGVLAFIAAPDYEAPADANADNVYDVIVQASDGGLTDTQAIAVTVTPVNELAPVITSNGGGASASVTVAENTTSVTTVAVTDADLPAQTLTYAIVGGADAARFSIDATTGVLAFTTAPDYEALADANADNVYDVIVQASDGGLTDTQAIAVTVTPVNELAPVIMSNGGGASASVTVAENTTAVTTVAAVDADVPAQTLTYAIVGGADAAQFSVDAATGALAFIAAPDYEAPADANADNVYDVTVQASDGGLTDTQAIAVTVTPVNELASVITSNGGGASASVTLAENTTAVTTVAAVDADLPAQTLTYAIVGGADAAQFSIDAATGALAFIAAPDYEAPADANADNVYDVTVQASDGGLADTQAIAVTVTPVNELAPVITSHGGGASASVTVAENMTAVTTVTAVDADVPAQTLTYAIVGGADAARFSVDAATGALVFVAAPNYEAPTDANADNVYDVIVQASDGSLTDTQSIAVLVTPVNEVSPVIDSNGGGATALVSAVENTTAVTTVTAADADVPAQTLTYAIVGGADAAQFSIDAATGALAFITAPDYEAPADANADNVYDVTVQASDGTLVRDQSLSVTVTDADETVAMAGQPNQASADVPPATPGVRQPAPAPSLDVRPLAIPEPGPKGSVDADVPDTPRDITVWGPSHANEALRLHAAAEETARSPRGAFAQDITISAWWASMQMSASQTAQHIRAQWHEDDLRVAAMEYHEPAHGEGEQRGLIGDWVIEAAIVGLSAGVTWWSSKSVGLMATMAASVRAWRSFDLLPVLKRSDDREELANRGEALPSQLWESNEPPEQRANGVMRLEAIE